MKSILIKLKGHPHVQKGTAYTILFAMGFCHLLNDMIQSVIPAMYPVLKDNFGFTFAQIGIITLVFQLTSSVFQPFVGQYAAIDLANEFLKQKELIVYTEGRAARRSDFFAKGTGNFKNGRLIILVDEYSASASEIVTGAIQDWDRGVVVGRRTFGKGLVQRPIDLPDGSMIRLTIARYYTPSGRCIQKPYDSTANLDGRLTGENSQDKYNQELIDRFNHGEMIHADSIHFADSLKAQTKRMGRTVYGGGGIMPDFFVPIDTTQYTDYHRNLVAKGVVIKATTGYIEKHRKELQNKYKKFEAFNEKFEIDDNFLAEIRTLADKEKIKFDEKQYNQSLPLIKTQLKALIARDLWDMNEYFQVMNSTNQSVQQALKVLNEGIYSTIIQ